MVKIYTIPNCQYCVELKEILVSENIEFTEVDVSLAENEIEYNKIHQISKSDDVPIIKVGKQLLIPNVSFKSIREAVDISKRFLI